MVRLDITYHDCDEEVTEGHGYHVDPILGYMGTAMAAELADGSQALVVVLPFATSDVQEVLHQCFYRFPDVFPARFKNPPLPTI